MGGGLRSRFKFPVPGRSSKKQDVPTASVSAPLSKAQRILGADGINTGSSRLAVNHGRSWETSSVGGISLSISESSASHMAPGPGFARGDDDSDDFNDTDNLPEAKYGRLTWEDEPEIILRPSRSAHEPGRMRLTTKPPPLPEGNDSHEQAAKQTTKACPRGRRLSSSTIDTHYDAAKMPLAISQQTSSSAMAKGIGPKISEILDIDGIYGGQPPAKKKPARLDLSRLKPKAHRNRNKNDTHCNDRYNMGSPAVVLHPVEPSIPSASTTGSAPRSAGKLMKPLPGTPSPQLLRSPRSRGITDATGLHQLYHHYEQMSFGEEEDQSEGQAEDEEVASATRRNLNHLRPPSTFTHSLIAPLPQPLPGRQGEDWGHSRIDSHDSRVTASVTGSATVPQANTTAREDYDASISSRHTRTSKASPSCRSVGDSDRLQNSVLSLSDSSDDEVMDPVVLESAPHHTTVGHGILPDSHYTVRGQRSHQKLHVNTATAKFTPSLNQLDEHLRVNSAPRSQSSRSPSNNTLRSSQSSMGTVTHAHTVPSSAGPNLRLSSRSTETLDTLGSSRQATYEVQEARVVSFMPLASTAEAASQVAISEHTTHIEKFISRQTSNATSRFSRNSDQPTPPLSPASVEFYMKSRESLQRDAMAGGSTEAHNARLMAVTRQEEMLLAALRKKRAKMREASPSEAEDERSPSARSKPGSFRSVNRSNTSSTKGGSREPTIPEHQSELAGDGWRTTDSRLFTRPSRDELRRPDQHRGFQKELHDADVPPTASRSDMTEGTATSATESASSAMFDSRSNRVPAYLDRPSQQMDTADPLDEDSSDYVDDSDGEDLIVNERRTSRMQFRRDSTCHATGVHKQANTGSQRGSNHNAQYRKDYVPMSPLSAPLRANRLQDVPEDEPRPVMGKFKGPKLGFDDHLDAFPEPPVPPPSWPLPPPPRPGKTAPVRANPPTGSLLHPSIATQTPLSAERRPEYMRNKRSHVRLSAVGHPHSPMPLWGDDD
ncbi:hypothetical protein F5Y17DRAFT_461982 [Xylariaceae sp. FL0594]|nr:hypothetical protein F5Y17DRAFT_461982 [Xylariaceae sp. FL0594]